MYTSRTSLDRLLDPAKASLTLQTLERAPLAPGKTKERIGIPPPDGHDLHRLRFCACPGSRGGGGSNPLTPTIKHSAFFSRRRGCLGGGPGMYDSKHNKNNERRDCD